MRTRVSCVPSNADKRSILCETSNSYNPTEKIPSKIETLTRQLSKLGKNHRLTLLGNKLSWLSAVQHRVVSSVEKNIYLVGPDCSYYFYDLSTGTHQLNLLNSQVGGIIVWGAISYHGTCEFQSLKSTMHAKLYRDVLEKACSLGHYRRFCNTTILCYSFEVATILAGPKHNGKCEWLARKFYECGKQLPIVTKLIKVIQPSWATISLDYMGSLYDSQLNRSTKLF